MTTYKNHRGKWTVDIDDFFHADGRKEPRIRKTSPVQTERAANQYERGIRQSLLDGTYGKRAVAPEMAPLFGEYAQVYMAKCEADRNKPKGVANYKSVLHAHLVPLFGDKRMNELSAEDEDTLRVRLKEHSASRYNQAIAVANGMTELFYARFRSRLQLQGEPFRFSRLKVVEEPKTFYSFEQYAALREAARGIGIISELAVTLGRDAGLRRGEMWGLQPKSCFPGHIMVVRSETLDGKKRHMGPPKGGKIRKVETTPDVQDVIRRYLKKYGHRERMIAQHDGTPFNQETFQAFMAAIQKAAGLDPTGETHVLRHTFCSHMAILGVPVKVIQELAGHAQLTTTLAYMHLAPGNTAQGIAALSRGNVHGYGNATATAAE